MQHQLDYLLVPEVLRQALMTELTYITWDRLECVMQT